MRLTNHAISLSFAACTAVLLITVAAARADDLQASINGQSFDQASGVISLNQAAGSGSQQSNVRSLSLSPGGYAQATTATVQTAAPAATAKTNISAAIGDGAFRGAAGLIGINQSVGASNVQANGVAIGLGQITEVSAASVLAGTAPNAAGLNGLDPARQIHRSINVDASAFVGAAGIVQVNQAGGTGNASANNFALGIAAPKP